MSKNWTTADIPDLTDKVVIVTGANSGIGFEATKELACKGAQTILACRNMEKAEAAWSAIRVEVPSAKGEVMELDLARLASVHQFATAFRAKYKRLDILINNAGIGGAAYSKTEDGFEMQLGVNHLGHYALTGLLLDLLIATPKARVVNISSGFHRLGKIDFEDMTFADGRDYTPMKGYGRSKLANLLFTYELQHRFQARGIDAMSVAAHPGASNTNIGADSPPPSGSLPKIMTWVVDRMRQSAAMGALPTLRVAVDPDVQGGDYFGPAGFMETTGHPVKVKSSKASYDTAVQQRLWELSEQLTNVRYSWSELAEA